MARFFDKLTKQKPNKAETFLRSFISGSMYRVSDIRGDSSLQDIRSTITMMRALARDSQVSTTLSYYATDATTTNSGGQIIWATADDPKFQEAADIINAKFKQWKVNKYARDHILELATVGNLYLPTTVMYRQDNGETKYRVALDSNTIVDDKFEMVPSTKIPPENILHLWKQGKPYGYIYQPDEKEITTITYSEESIIHFALGGLLGDYTIECKNSKGDVDTYDIQFANPILQEAIQPTQTLSLLEDAVVLSSLIRTVKFIAVECGNAEEEEIQSTLLELKSMIEQQMSLNTSNGDAQSFVNPQSPNNLIYLPKINGADPISITDLNMGEASDADNKLLDYYQNKKLSVLGIPKEALNFSSSEGLGGAGQVMSQRSALYGNILQRIETAYMEGWTDAFNKYFIARGLSGFVDTFTLHMNPIVTQMSTINFEKRDAALGQATTIVQLMKDIGIKNAEDYKQAITELLTDVLPQTGSNVNSWDVDVTVEEGGAGGEF